MVKKIINLMKAFILFYSLPPPPIDFLLHLLVEEELVSLVQSPHKPYKHYTTNYFLLQTL